MPALDEHGTTYNDVIRRIEEMDAAEFKDSSEYESVNLSAVEIPDFFISGGLADAEVYRDTKGQEEDISEKQETLLPDDETVKINNVSDKEERTFFDFPRAQIDGGAKSSVTNLLEVLHDVRWYNDKFKCPVYMRGATSKKLIIPKAIGKLRVQANTRTGWLDCDC